MDTYADVLMEDLIDYTEESNDVPNSIWTEQALDLFISLLKNIKKGNFSNQHDMLEVITLKMTERRYKFTVDQIERKYNSLQKMYKDKKDKNQTVEQELINLFGDIKDSWSTQEQKGQKLEQPPQKKAKVDTTDERLPNRDKSIQASLEENEDKKAFWSSGATKNFLDLLEELRPQLGSQLRTKKQMWEEITKRLNALGFVYNPSQVENKWKALLRHYRGRLELLRKGKIKGSFARLQSNYSAWPELFNTSIEKDISFANDQSLPYDDDGYTDEEPYQFEEASPGGDELDPMLLEDTKPTTILNEKPSSSKEPEITLENDVTHLDKIIREISNFREDNQKHQHQLITLKKMELQAYKERTIQFTRIANGIGDLMGYLKRKESDESF